MPVPQELWELFLRTELQCDRPSDSFPTRAIVLIILFKQERSPHQSSRSLALEKNRGFKDHELNQIAKLVEEHQTVLLDAWHDYFDT